jgi:hypothetical protein
VVVNCYVTTKKEDITTSYITYRQGMCSYFHDSNGCPISLLQRRLANSHSSKRRSNETLGMVEEGRK